MNDGDKLILNKRLIQACRSFSNSISDDVKEIIGKGADINYLDNYHAHTPLIISVLYHNYNLCNYLIEKGADIDFQNIYGNNALSCSVYIDKITFIELLLDQGANIDLKNNLHMTPLIIANNRGRKKSIEILEKHIIQKKLLIVHKNLSLGKLFMSDIGSYLVEEALYEQISLLIK